MGEGKTLCENKLLNVNKYLAVKSSYQDMVGRVFVYFFKINYVNKLTCLESSSSVVKCSMRNVDCST